MESGDEQHATDETEGSSHPLAEVFGELSDLAELEKLFADLDTKSVSASLNDDPFADIAAVLAEQPYEEYHAYQLSSEHDAEFNPNLSEIDDDENQIIQNAIDIESYCQQALDAMDADEIDEARAHALAAVRIDDEHPFPIFILGLIAEQEGDLTTARDMADLALRSAATNPDAIALRSHIHVSQHEYEPAENLLRFGIAHNPDEAMLHESLARVLLARGNYADAFSAAQVALKLEPENTGALTVRAAALHEVADRETALATLRQSVLLYPSDPYAMVELASLEVEHGNVERARLLLGKAQHLAPHDSEIQDIRVLIEHLGTNVLLRPIPRVLKWTRSFPGGLVGFILGFLIAALPLHALALHLPGYRVPALTILSVWGAFAIYAWVAPSILTHLLNRRSAATAYSRAVSLLKESASSSLRSKGTASAESMIVYVCDAAALLLDARMRRAACSLLTECAAVTSAPPNITARLNQLSFTLNRWPIKIGLFVLSIPALDRILTIVAAALMITSVTLAEMMSTSSLLIFAVGGLVMSSALVMMLFDAKLRACFDREISEIQIGNTQN